MCGASTLLLHYRRTITVHHQTHYTIPLLANTFNHEQIDQKTQRQTGRQAQLSNIAAARAVADIIRTTLGPRSMLKVCTPTCLRASLAAALVWKCITFSMMSFCKSSCPVYRFFVYHVLINMNSDAPRSNGRHCHYQRRPLHPS